MENKRISLLFVLVIIFTTFVCMGGVANAITLTDSDAKITNYESDFGDGINDDNASSSEPYYHQIYSATSTDGINWIADDTLLFDHASVPGAVYFNNEVYLYYVNAADPEHEKLSVGISEDRGATFTVHDVQISGSNSPHPVDPNPIIDGDQIRLTYLGNFNQGETNNIVTATSSDGVNFTEDGVIFTGDVYDPDLFYDEVGGEWVLFLNTGGLTKATSSSPTGPFTEDPDFSWTSGSISSTHKIGEKYYTYYAGAGICVAEYINGNLANIADGIVDFPGMTADPTVAVFGPNEYKMFFKTVVGEEPPPTPEVTVEFIDSTYEHVTEKPSGWFETGQEADILLSGVDFNNAGGPLLFNHQGGIASDGQHLILADRNNNRVLIWNTLPAGNMSPDIVLGQNNFTSNDPGNSLAKLNWPVAVATDGEHLLVADTYNDRVLIWNSFPAENGQPADFELRGSTEIGSRGAVGWPWAVWTNGEKVIVTSTGTSQVLIWNTFPAENMMPDIILKLDDFGTPRTIGSDGTNLIIGDHNMFKKDPGNFFWRSFPTKDDQPYDFFMRNVKSEMPPPINGEIMGDVFWGPTFTSDGKLIIVSDKLYIWNSFPENENDAPDISIGSGYGGNGYDFGGSQSGDGSGIAFAGGKLYISLCNGNKIVGFNALPQEPEQKPDFVIGSPDIYTNTLETEFIMSNPVPATDGESLFVSSDFDGKLYVWKALPDESGAKPDFVYNLPEGPWDNTIFGNTLVLAGRQTVFIWNALPLNGEKPDVIFRKNIGSVELDDIAGVAMDDKYFYLADARAQKIYVWNDIPGAESEPLFSIDCDSPTRLSSDGKYLAVAATLSSYPGGAVMIYKLDELPDTQPTVLHGMFNLPQGTLVYEGSLFVGDTGFNAVHIWKDIKDAISGKEADVLLGEKGYRPEIGRNKLFWPAVPAFDGSYLWIGEFKFSERVVRFPVKPIPHDPISINGNSDFETQASNEGWIGNGTEESPYIIENYDINASITNGIAVRNTDVHFIIRNCVIHNNSDGGIYFQNVENSTVSSNYISSNLYGIFLDSCHNNLFDLNTITDSVNGDGISMDNSSGNELKSNTIESSKYNGIGLFSSSNNLIYHNNLTDNSPNGYDDTGNNSWDNGSEGNYWGDYTGVDEDKDGIGDTPYEIPGGVGASDNYPLMEPYSPNNPPNQPSNPSPANEATGVSIPVTLSVTASDPDGDTVTVTFYDASDDSIIETDAGVASGSRAEVVWSGLAANTTYSWYARANDGELDSPQSDTWSFTTAGEWAPWDYDEDDSSYIEITELLHAISDYIGEDISISQLLEIISLYISHTPK